ncbi:MAG TPA: hypothetical protein GX512_01620 [Firmicutes bacterium]|nr:hypothetical protein [Candidatus Fermentithermobacillaceae bacterium]
MAQSEGQVKEEGDGEDSLGTRWVALDGLQSVELSPNAEMALSGAGLDRMMNRRVV